MTAEMGCGHGSLIHYQEPPYIIYGTRQGRRVFTQMNDLRARHGRRM